MGPLTTIVIDKFLNKLANLLNHQINDFLPNLYAECVYLHIHYDAPCYAHRWQLFTGA